MPQKPRNYSHWVYMETHSITPSDLPEKLKEAHTLWLNRYNQTTHDGRRLDPALKKASDSLFKGIKAWHNTDAEFEKLADEKPKNYGKPTDDEILEFFHSIKKKDTVTRAELLEKGYRKDFLGYINLSTKNYRLKAIKGEKNTYTLTKK